MTTIFNTDDSHALLIAYLQFDSLVSPEKRIAYLESMWFDNQQDQNNIFVQEAILDYLMQSNHRSLLSGPTIARLLDAGAQSEQIATRYTTLFAYNLETNNKYADRILRFLQDKNDNIRSQAVIIVCERSDARDILSDYVKQNEGSDEYEDSVRRAKLFLQQD